MNDVKPLPEPVALFISLVIFSLAVVVYFIPAIIAFKRGKRDWLAIGALGYRNGKGGKGRSGIYGVQRVIDRQTRPWRKYWRATWSPELGVVRKKQFSIRKFGEEKAKLLAIRARRAGLQSMI